MPEWLAKVILIHDDGFAMMMNLENEHDVLFLEEQSTTMRTARKNLAERFH